MQFVHFEKLKCSFYSLLSSLCFSLPGYLAGTGSKYRMSHCSSFSLEHKTLMTIPNGSKISQSSMAPHGSRVFHGNQVRSASSKGAFLNRPLSPHLALKKPQLSATYSISHRIFGAALAGVIMLSPIAMRSKILCDV